MVEFYSLCVFAGLSKRRWGGRGWPFISGFPFISGEGGAWHSGVEEAFGFGVGDTGEDVALGFFFVTEGVVSFLVDFSFEEADHTFAAAAGATGVVDIDVVFFGEFEE